MKIGEIVKKALFKRDYLEKILKWLDDKEMIVLTGPRQSGKTSLLYGIIKHLIQNNIARENDILFYDAEDPAISELFSSGTANVIGEIRPGEGEKKYLFIDEAHYINDAGRMLKYLVDHYGEKVKVFISGSSSLEITKAFRESMTGRKIVFEVLPLSFGEFLEFKGRPDLRNTGGGIKVSEREEAKRLFHEFCMFGGYPRVALENDLEKKKAILKEIYSSYVRKDIASFFGAGTHDKFNNLVKYIAVNNGQIFNVHSACTNAGGISRPTVERYTGILEGTFITRKIPPFHGNKNKEIVKMGKLYFIDNGLRNAVVNNFNALDERSDAGGALETAALRQLLDRYPEKEAVKFYRTKSGLEVDFVADGGKIKAFEVKKNGDNFRENSVADFIKKYKINGFTVLNLTRSGPNNGFNYEYIYEFATGGK